MNDIHATILETFFFGYIDRNIGADETPLFTRTHEGEPLSDVIARDSSFTQDEAEAAIEAAEGGGAVNRDIYEAITERFIEQLKRGTVPWQKPWFAVQNIVSRKPYRGINALLLGSTDYQSPFWISFKQALDLGGHVKKGEKSTPVIYYKILEKRDEAGNIVVREDGRPARIPFVRWANVFNLDQTEGIQAPAITASQNVTQPHEKAAAIVENARLCPIHHAGFAALYSPTDDVIRIPAPSTFHSQEDYYHTLYHELTHNAVTRIMPHGLRWRLVCRASAMRRVRHNQSPSRNARSWSSGRKRPGGVAGAATRASAFSFIRMSAWM